MMPTFQISPEALGAIVRRARQARPRECCDILVGTREAVVEAVQTRNLAREPTRFLIDPRGHIEARRDARRRGLKVVGFYHSHPQTAPYPSPRDLTEASYSDCLYLIVSVARGRAETKLFRLAGGGFVEVGLVVQNTSLAPGCT